MKRFLLRLTCSSVALVGASSLALAGTASAATATTTTTTSSTSTCNGTNYDVQALTIVVSGVSGQTTYSYVGDPVPPFLFVNAGDTLKATVTLIAGCTETVSAASFIAPVNGYDPSLINEQQLFQSASATAVGGVPVTVSVTLPGSTTVGTSTGCTNTHSASFNGHGANTSGNYNSTCNGSPSQNGQGTSSSSNKPCAGCVGNADNKNPPGQYPNGSDHNAGYECDRNQGVGQGNPAHSGCVTHFQYDLAVGPVRVPPQYGGALVATATG